MLTVYVKGAADIEIKLALVSDQAPETVAATMKATVQEEYGSSDKLELREVEKPVVGDDDVLVRVRAAAVNALDWRVMRGLPLPGPHE